MTQVSETPQGQIAARTTRRAIVAIPGRAADVLAPGTATRWLARASFRPCVPTVPLLERILAELALPAPQAGRAALRLWGHTGQQPAGWVAAADPVWMQAGLEKLFVHVPPAGEVEHDALSAMFEDLQASLFAERQLTLFAHGDMGYVRGDRPLLTASLPPTAIDQSRPDAFMPDIHDAASRDYYGLCSEIEMTLHDHRYNREREQRGQRPLNALWLWGGGLADKPQPRSLPPVFTDDPLLRGYCLFSDSGCASWPGALAACLDAAPDGFIAALPALSETSIAGVAAELRSLWQAKRVPRMTVLLDDIAIDLERGFRSFLRRGGEQQLRKYLNDE